jgi:hypothetical protein
VNSQFSEFPLCSVRLSVIATQFPALVLDRVWLLKTNLLQATRVPLAIY